MTRMRAKYGIESGGGGGGGGGGYGVNATFNNISAISSWRSVLFVEETPIPKENHRPGTSH